MDLGANPSGSAFRAAFSRLSVNARKFPAFVQAIVSHDVLHNWQWAQATWVTPLDYWSGQERASVRWGIGEPDLSAMPQHPETIWGHGQAGRINGVHRAKWWPDPIDAPYIPIDPMDMVAKIKELDGRSPIYVSVTLPQIESVEAHAHPRQTALAATRANMLAFDWSQYSLLTGVSSIPF